jgi:hypothetical protein
MRLLSWSAGGDLIHRRRIGRAAETRRSLRRSSQAG